MGRKYLIYLVVALFGLFFSNKQLLAQESNLQSSTEEPFDWKQFFGLETALSYQVIWPTDDLSTPLFGSRAHIGLILEKNNDPLTFIVAWGRSTNGHTGKIKSLMSLDIGFSYPTWLNIKRGPSKFSLDLAAFATKNWFQKEDSKIGRWGLSCEYSLNYSYTLKQGTSIGVRLSGYLGSSFQYFFTRDKYGTQGLGLGVFYRL